MIALSFSNMHSIFRCTISIAFCILRKYLELEWFGKKYISVFMTPENYIKNRGLKIFFLFVQRSDTSVFHPWYWWISVKWINSFNFFFFFKNFYCGCYIVVCVNLFDNLIKKRNCLETLLNTRMEIDDVKSFIKKVTFTDLCMNKGLKWDGDIFSYFRVFMIPGTAWLHVLI